MDDRRLARIEGLLDQLLQQSLPRAEFEERFSRLERRVGRALDGLGRAEVQLERYEDLEERVDKIEDFTIPAKHSHRRRVYLWPTIAAVASLIANVCIGIATWFVTRSGGVHH